MRADDQTWMAEALAEARVAAAAGEAPIGAVVVFENSIVGRGRNAVEARRDPTAHAEILALRDAARTLDRWRLSGCALYVTLEPCAMCLGACYAARLERLVFGAGSPKFGALGSAVSLTGVEGLNHRLETTGGVLERDCRELLKVFFERLREK